jgi:4-amino-4-deoxy-L-arabinose transferase-like glycosyltransferase
MRRRPRLPWWLHAGLAGLAVLHVVLAVTAASRLSLTFDELAHLTAGASYVAYGDERLQPENGWLPQYLIGWGTRLGGVAAPTLDDQLWPTSDVWNLGRVWLSRDDVPVVAAAFWGRLPISLLSGGLVGLIGLFSARVLGAAAGLVSGAVAALSPTLLAHGGLATSDTAAALMLLSVVLAYWQGLHRMTWGAVAVCLAVAPLMALAKFSAVLIPPITLGLLAIKVVGGRAMWARRWRTRRRGPQLVRGLGLWLAMLLAGAVGVWLAFGLEGPSDRTDFEHFFRADDVAAREGSSLTLTRWIDAQGLLPEAYAYGLEYVLAMSQRRVSFFHGEVSPTGFAGFFPYLWAVKTPLAVFFGLALAAGAFAQRRDRWGRLYRLTPVLLLGGVFLIVALRSNLNIGHRHLLPIYPVMFVLLGLAATWLSRPGERRVGLGCVALVLGGVAAESTLIRPQYLSFFNPLDGGPTRAHHAVVDSSLDWGQNLPQLAEQLGSSDESTDASGRWPEPIYLAYFGSADPRWYGIDRVLPLDATDRPLNSDMIAPLRPGTYVFSVTQLQRVYGGAVTWTARHERVYRDARQIVEIALTHRDDPDLLRELYDEVGGAERFHAIATHYWKTRFSRLAYWLTLNREPDARAGYSIHLYRLTAAELAAALDGPVPIEPTPPEEP